MYFYKSRDMPIGFYVSFAMFTSTIMDRVIDTVFSTRGSET